MHRAFVTLGWAVAAFISTNLDDLLLLASLFVEVDFSPRSVIFGQFIGMNVLVLASLAAALLAVASPAGWPALLGFVPFLLGLKRCRKWWRDRRVRRGIPSQGFIGADRLECPHSPYAVWTVTILTIANGGDNLSVYIPLFASERALIPIYLVAFTLLTGIWCLLGYWLTHQPLLRARLIQYGPIVTPVVLVGIGLKVLAGARVFWQ
jgi:cadmium resistance protein CadD (predicted permease)